MSFTNPSSVLRTIKTKGTNIVRQGGVGLAKLKANSLKYIGIATGIIILILFIYIGIEHRRINRLTNEKQLQEIELSTLKKSISVYQDKNGELTYKLNVVEVSHRNMEDGLAALGIDKKKLKAENIRLNNVIAALKLEIESSGSISVPLQDSSTVTSTASGADTTVTFKKFDYWTDNRLTLFGGTVRNNQLDIENYTFNLKFDIVPTYEKKQTIVNVKFEDPHTVVKSATAITLEKPKKKWYQRPSVWAAIAFTGGIIVAK